MAWQFSFKKVHELAYLIFHRMKEHYRLYVTVSAKTSLVRTKILIHFLPQLIAILNSYPHSMSPMARLKRSAFLKGGFTAL